MLIKDWPRIPESATVEFEFPWLLHFVRSRGARRQSFVFCCSVRHPKLATERPPPSLLLLLLVKVSEAKERKVTAKSMPFWNKVCLSFAFISPCDIPSFFLLPRLPISFLHDPVNFLIGFMSISGRTLINPSPLHDERRVPQSDQK